MWEFDRLREVVFQIDTWLPPDSPVLMVAVRIRNPNRLHGADVLVDATPPCRKATRCESLPRPIRRSRATTRTGSPGSGRPTRTGVDCTWPTRNRRARDFFFDLEPARRRWILAADEDGDGLAMLSTARLRGRKLFVWGEGAGGHRWQDWLSPAGGRYAEIQAGLAQTQFQHLEMPAGAEWSWVEAYGNAARRHRHRARRRLAGAALATAKSGSRVARPRRPRGSAGEAVGGCAARASDQHRQRLGRVGGAAAGGIRPALDRRDRYSVRAPDPHRPAGTVAETAGGRGLWRSGLPRRAEFRAR